MSDIGWLLEDRPDIQNAINSGIAWKLEGSYGRLAMEYIEAGACVLGEVAHTDYWGNRIPSRYEVKPGTKGSLEYAEQNGWTALV